jgi:hypothetical protein
VPPRHQNYLGNRGGLRPSALRHTLASNSCHRLASRLTGSVMERLPDFVRARLWQLSQSKPPPTRLLADLRELAQEYKAVLSDDAARYWCGAENGY